MNRGLAAALGIGAALAASSAVAQADTAEPRTSPASETSSSAAASSPRPVNRVRTTAKPAAGRTALSAARSAPTATLSAASVLPAGPAAPLPAASALTAFAWVGREIEVAAAAASTQRQLRKTTVAVPVVTGPVAAPVLSAPVAVPVVTTPTAQSAAPVASPVATTASTVTQVATAAVAPTTTLEAEALTVTPVKAGSRYSDTTASAGRALLLSTNGTAAITQTLPAFAGLVIRARGDQYNGAPIMTVSIDGTVVATTSVSATTWTDYPVLVSGAAGSHTISIAFTNDLRRSASRDRNLRIDKITVVADTTTVPPDGTPPVTTPAYFGAADWLWKPIAANPTLAADSATWVSYFSAPGTKRIANLYHYGVTLVPASAITTSTPRYDVRFTKAWGSDPFGTTTVALPRGTRVPPGSDGHVAVMDPTTGMAYGIWQAKYDPATDTWSGSWGGSTPINGNGVDTSGSATAAGISRYAGVVTASELQTAIAANTGLNHALVFSSDIAGPGFVGPAIKSDGANLAGVATPIPQGYRIQLDPSINVDAIPNITPGEKVIAKTLQTHGAYVIDQGGARMAFAFETVPDATSTNPGAVYTQAGFAWDYYDMNHIPWSQLRVIAA